MVSIPVYIRLLGASEWGLISACISLQLVSNFVDAGFSQLIPRWVALEAQDNFKLRQILKFFQKIYISLGFLLFFGIQLSANYLAISWFQIDLVKTDSFELIIRIFSFQMLFQFINNLYTGFWHGLQKQVLANLRACGFGTMKHVVTMGTLLIWPRYTWLYAATFAVIALIEFVTNATTVHRMLEKGNALKQEYQIKIAPFLREVLFLSGGILLGLLTSHLDRIVLSRSVSIEDFGIYSVVIAFALAFLQLQTPFTRAYFPLIAQDIKATGHASLVHLKRMITGTILFVTTPSILASVFAESLLELWINQARFVFLGTIPLQLLLLAVGANSLYNCFYVIIIASGKSHLIVKFNFAALIVAIIIATIVDPVNGIIKGGIIWLSSTITQLMLAIIWYLNFEYKERTTIKNII